jgi:hypothetical protein
MSARIGQAEIESLPRWPRLALAVRCVRRARDLVGPAGRAAAIIDDALARVDQSARTGAASEDLADAAASAYTLALDHLDGEGPGDDHDAVVRTCMIAHATAFAAEAATLDEPRQAAHLVAQAIDFAVHACRLTDPGLAAAAVSAMRADLDQLSRASFVPGD